MAAFKQLYVPRLGDLVGGVVGYVDPPAVVPRFVPPFGEGYHIIAVDALLEKPADLGVSVNPHVGCEQRMVVGVVGIVLGSIPCRDEQIRGEVKDQTAVLVPEPALQP
ncbi:hypothetical protein SDC9_155019 [bioreactor metagenome]|uniref:Uncharacterized protein n=1 Tax=bioreactor metagenome TaxID=1076179 RepID=A0A645F0M7_9ZZZZ